MRMCMASALGRFVFVVGTVGAGILLHERPAFADEVNFFFKPCRLVDTRNTGGALAANTILAIDVRGANLGAAQGGDTGCAAPLTAEGILVNLTVISPSGTGHAVLWSYDTSISPTSSLNFSTSAVATNDGLMVRLPPFGEAHDLKLQATHSANWTIDIVGWTKKNPTSYMRGVINDVDGTLNSVQFLIEGQFLPAVCIEPWIPDLAQCQQFGDSDEVCMTGHIDPALQKFYVHTINDCI